MKKYLKCLGLTLLLAPGFASAWSANGHRMVAELAEQRLTPKALAQARALLATSGDAHLSDVASWADELRKDPKQTELGRQTAKKHYINYADSTCRFNAKRDCRDGQCVVAAIDEYAKILGDRKRSMSERAQALRFVVHFVGDAHQPLHAGYRGDAGGNRYQIQYNGKGTNLHAIWDNPILATRKLSWQKHAAAIRPKASEKAAGNPQQWAAESCRITRDDGVYPRGHKIDQSYLESMRPIVERRIQLAAIRLAGVLNRELDK
jgi:hypothetical protein